MSKEYDFTGAVFLVVLMTLVGIIGLAVHEPAGRDLLILASVSLIGLVVAAIVDGDVDG